MDESVLKGNTAIFKCHIPSFVSDYVQVVSWLQDEKKEIAQKNKNYGVLFCEEFARFSRYPSLTHSCSLKS